jgi:hypothetical protein
MPNFAPRAACFASRERNNRWRLFLSARQQKQHTHTQAPLQPAHANFFCQYIYLGERRLQNKGEGQTPVRTIEKNVSVTPSSAARSAFPSAAARLCRLPGYFFLASSSLRSLGRLAFFHVFASPSVAAPRSHGVRMCVYTENNQVKLP